MLMYMHRCIYKALNIVFKLDIIKKKPLKRLNFYGMSNVVSSGILIVLAGKCAFSHT
jgi:hypothetical protein